MAKIIGLCVMAVAIVVPMIVLAASTAKSERLRARHDREWMQLYEEIKDDPELLELWVTLTMMRG